MVEECVRFLDRDGLHSFGIILRREEGGIVIIRKFIVSKIEVGHPDRVLRHANEMILDESVAEISLPSSSILDSIVVLKHSFYSPMQGENLQNGKLMRNHLLWLMRQN